MKIDRTARQNGTEYAQEGDSKSCLDCTACSKLCWTFLELTSLPGAVLSDRVGGKA